MRVRLLMAVALKTDDFASGRERRETVDVPRSRYRCSGIILDRERKTGGQCAGVKGDELSESVWAESDGERRLLRKRHIMGGIRMKKKLAMLLTLFLLTAGVSGCTDEDIQAICDLLDLLLASQTESAEESETPSAANWTEDETDVGAIEDLGETQSWRETVIWSSDSAYEAESTVYLETELEGSVEDAGTETAGTETYESLIETDTSELIPEDVETDLGTVTVTEDGYYYYVEEVALYIATYGHLPSNYITKKQAQDRGWINSKGNLWKVAPGMCIGGDRFGNYEGQLPKKKGRTYTECDVNYEGGYRQTDRIIFSNDGLVYYTQDHYETFTLLYGEE